MLPPSRPSKWFLARAPYHRVVRGPSDVERAVVAQWQAAGPALAEIRRCELREMTDEHALVAVLALLDLLPHLPPKTGGSGLVEQQRLFALATR